MSNTKCEGCGTAGSDLVSIHVMNGVFCVCPQCLEQVNRKNPELKTLRDENAAFRTVFGLKNGDKVVSGSPDGSILVDGFGGQRTRIWLAPELSEKDLL